MPEPRNKMSPPPLPLASDSDRAVLAGLLHSTAYPLLLDIIHGYAIEQEVELYVNEIGDPKITLERVYAARAAWLVLDRIQFRVQRSADVEADMQEKDRMTGDGRVKTTEEILGVE